MGSSHQPRLRATALRALAMTGMSIFGALAAAAAPAQSDGEAEIIVTARKRAEAIERVPGAITLISGAEARERGISDFTGLVDQVAGVSINYAFGGPSYGLLSIRGAGGADDYKPNGNSSVALHVDGVYQTSNAFLGTPLFDLERMEVLKGPQGTLYGRNSTAGVVNAITRSPGETFDGFVDVRAGNYESFGFETALGGPVNDVLAVRLALFGDYGGGFMNGRGAGALAGFQPSLGGVRQSQVTPIRDPGPRKGFGDKNMTAARATFVLTPDDLSSLTFKTFVSLDRSDTRQYDRVAFARDTAAVGGVRINPGENEDPFEFFSQDYFRQRIEVSGFSTDYQRRLGETLTLAVLAGYQASTRDVGGNGDGTPFPSGGQFRFDEKLEQGSLEVRLAGEKDSWGWIVGAFAVQDEVDFNSQWTSFNARTIYLSPYAQIRRSAAVFGQVGLDVTERLTLDAGLRLTADQVDFKGRNIDLNPWGITNYNATFGTTSNFSWKRDFEDDDVSGRVSAQYALADSLQVYAAYGVGYRGGGFDGTSIFTPEETAPIQSETVTAIEGGVRFTTSRLRATLDAFRNEYEDLQATTRLSNDTNGRTNVGAAWTEGLELSLGAAIVDGDVHSLDLDVTLALLDSKITSFRSNRAADVRGTIGDPLPGAPDVSGVLSLAYEARLMSGWRLAARSDVSHHGEETNRLNALPDNTVKPYTLLNLRAEIKTPDDWGLYLYGRNVTDEVYFPELNGASRLVGAPRTYGAGIRRTF